MDEIADRCDALHVAALEFDAELLFEDLAELEEVERVDVQRLECDLRLDQLTLGAELDERIGDDPLDLVLRDR